MSTLFGSRPGGAEQARAQPRSGWVGLIGVLAAVVATGWLDLTSGADVYRYTISGYVFTHPVTFTSAVLALVVGSVAILFGLVRHRVLTAWHPASWLLAAWILGLLAVAVFPKHDWSVGPSLSGQVHRIGSLVAFLALPFAVILLTRRAALRGVGWPVFLSLGFALGSLGYLGYLASEIYAAGQDGIRWWVAVPLGLAERTLLALEVAALASLAVGLLTRQRHTVR